MKSKSAQIENEIMIADILLRITVLEKLLVSKGLLNQEEINAMMEDLSSKVLKSILETSNVPGNHEEILESIKVNKLKN